MCVCVCVHVQSCQERRWSTRAAIAAATAGKSRTGREKRAKNKSSERIRRRQWNKGPGRGREKVEEEALRHSQPRMQRRRIGWQRQSVHDSQTSFTSIPLSLSFSRPLLPLLPPSALATVGVAGARRSKGTEGARAGGVRSALASALCPSLGFTASASPLSSFSLSLTPYLCFTRLLHRHSLCSLDSLIAALDERRQGERGDTHDSRRRSVQRRRAACARASVPVSSLVALQFRECLSLPVWSLLLLPSPPTAAASSSP